MAFGWSGADPTDNPSDLGQYTLGVVQRANVDVTLTKVRVWHSSSVQASVSGRKAYIWDNATQALLGTATLPAVLPGGWSSYDLDAPVAMTTGDTWVVAYDQQGGGYGTFANAFLNGGINSLDAAITFPKSSDVSPGNGRFITDAFATYPTNTFNATFYGIDTEYDITGSGNPPEVTGVTVSLDNLSVAITGAVTDADGLTGATYTVDWGDGQESSGSTATFSHTYASAGTYACVFVVKDTTDLYGFRGFSVEAVAAPGAFPPNSELVAVAFIKTLPGIDSGQVATTLPEDTSRWDELGFVELTVVGGNPGMYTENRTVVVSVDVWAVNRNSSKAPWGKAFTLAQRVISGLYGDVAQELTLPAAFGPARVMSAYSLSEPRRIENDDASYAHVQFDVQLNWVYVLTD